jgi:hypothetical protein
MALSTHGGSAILMVIAAILLLPNDAGAQVIQEVEVTRHILPPPSLPTHHDSDDIMGNTSADITEDIFAQIGSLPASRFQATSAAGRFGSVGLIASSTESGASRITSVVRIRSNEFVNLSGFPQQAVANFAIDGGSLIAIAAENASAHYSLLMEAHLDAGSVSFSTGGSLRADEFRNLVFTSTGSEIGATFDQQTGRVNIPLSFQSLDLGIVAPGEQFAIEYQLELAVNIGDIFASQVGSGGEGVIARFSDPLTLSGRPLMPTINWIPEPSSLFSIVGFATLAVAAFASRRRARL